MIKIHCSEVRLIVGQKKSQTMGWPEIYCLDVRTEARTRARTRT